MYDALGRKVRTLVDGPLTSGKHTVVWDGRNDSSIPVSSGVYLYRLNVGGITDTRRMTLVR